MRIFYSLALFSATNLVAVSGYGYKYNRNPLTGECSLQLNLPGGNGGKEAYPGIMNTRYGSNDGKYFGGNSDGKYVGSSSSLQSSLSSYGGGSYGSTGSYVGSSGGSYGAGSGGNSGKYGSNYGSSGEGAYGGASSEYGGSSASKGYGGKPNNKYPSYNYGGSGTSGSYGGSGAGTSKYGSNNSYGSSSANRGAASTNTDRNYQSSASGISTNRGNSYGGSGNRNTAAKSYGSSSAYDRDRNTGSNLGGSSSSPYNRGTGSYDRDEDYSKQASREASYESSADKYGSSASSSGSLGSGSSSFANGYRPTTTRQPSRNPLSSSGNRGIGNYGGLSGSAEKYGESDRYPSSPYTQGLKNGPGTGSGYPSTGSGLNKDRLVNERAPNSGIYPSASPASSERFASSDRDSAYDRPAAPRPLIPSNPSYNRGVGEEYKEEYSRSKSVSASSSSKTTKETVYVPNSSNKGSGGNSGLPSYNAGAVGAPSYPQVPTEFEDCGVYEYYSKQFRKCIRFGSPEDVKLQKEKNDDRPFAPPPNNRGVGSGANSYGQNKGVGGGAGSSYSNTGVGGGFSGGSYNRGSGEGSNSRYSSGSGSSYSASKSSGLSGSKSSGSSAYGGSSSEDENRYGNKGQSSSSDIDSSEDEYLMKEFAKDVLKSHNSYRARHTTPPVTLDDRMSIKAQEWAYDLAAGRVLYGHSPDALEGSYGESLQILNDPFATGKDAVEKWYEEKYNYNFKQPTLVKSPRTRSNSHFTAIVWKGTRKIGVGKATAKDGRTFVVVNYWPTGNIVDVLEDNVLPSRTDLGSDRETFY